MKDVGKIIVAILVIVMAWKILKFAVAIMVWLIVAALVVYGGVKLVEAAGTKRLK